MHNAIYLSNSYPGEGRDLTGVGVTLLVYEAEQLICSGYFIAQIDPTLIGSSNNLLTSHE